MLYKFVYKTSEQKRAISSISYYEDSVTVQAGNENDAWDNLSKFWETQVPYKLSSNNDSKPYHDVHKAFDIFPLGENDGVVGYHMSVCSTPAFLDTLLKPIESDSDVVSNSDLSQDARKVLNDLISDSLVKGVAESFNISFEEARIIIEDARKRLRLE